MDRVFNTLRRDFTVAPNALIQDPEITPQARALFVFMASMPIDWEFYHAPIMANMKWGDETLAKYLQELLNAGWMTREERRQAGMFAGWDYALHSQPVTVPEKNRAGKKPGRKKLDVQKIHSINLPLHAREEIPWQADPEQRMRSAWSALVAALNLQPKRWKEIANEAQNPLPKEAFGTELKDWLRFHSDNWNIICNPVRSLTSRPGNFISWLAKPYCREKYAEKVQPNQAGGQDPAPVVYYEPPKKR